MRFKIANVITSFNSASGGPPRTVSLIAEAARGHWRMELFTTDAMGPPPDCLLTDEFAGHVNMLPAWRISTFGGLLMAAGLFRGYRAQLLHGVLPDIVHVHGMWNPYLLAYASTALQNDIPYIVAPHGMLEPWSLSVHSLRKSLALRTYQGRLLARAAAIHATSESEAQNLRRIPCIRSPIFVVPNATEEPKALAPGVSPEPGQRCLLFLSRLHEKKGLDMLLDAWNQIRPGGWKLLIVGTGEPAYLARLKRFCETNRVPDVEFPGHVDGDAREAMFQRASAVVLPTYSENFGNIVAEALIRGLPVITTTGTPWSVLSEERLGWYIEPRVEPLRQALVELFATEPAQLAAMGERGRSYAQARFSVPAVRERLLDMYVTVLGEAGGRRQDPMPRSSAA